MKKKQPEEAQSMQEILEVALEKGFTTFRVNNHPKKGDINFLIVPIYAK